MGLPIKKDAKLTGKNSKSSATNSKFITKPSGGKVVGAAKKPIKTGGTRGS